MKIIEANPAHAELLSDLAFESKSRWGYPGTFIIARSAIALRTEPADRVKQIVA